MTTRAPNILLLFSDQQRPDTMGCYGQKLPITPHLDRLAAEGVRFESAFTCQPVCGPARAALQTGKWATQTGCFKNDIALPETERTLAHYLGDAGYQTGYVGKWHLASTGKGQNYQTSAVPPHLRGGYRDFWVASDVLEFTSHSYDGHLFDADGNQRDFPPGRYRADVLGDHAIDFLRQRQTDKPFFLFVSWIEPHHQNDHNCYEGPHGAKERFRDYAVPGDLAGTAGDWRESYPDYLGCCWSLDQNVGRIREELERQGILDDTLIVYTSDHGSHFRTRNAEYKRSCHDNCLRIPLIVRGPGFAGGSAPQALTSLLDVPPTLLTAAGVEPPALMVGRALQSLAAGTAKEWRDAVYAEISESYIGRCIRTSRWKYAVWVPSESHWSGSQNASSPVYHEHYLYNLVADPCERHNLVTSPEHAAVRAELALRLQRAVVEAGEAEPLIHPAVGA